MSDGPPQEHEIDGNGILKRLSPSQTCTNRIIDRQRTSIFGCPRRETSLVKVVEVQVIVVTRCKVVLVQGDEHCHRALSGSNWTYRSILAIGRRKTSTKKVASAKDDEAASFIIGKFHHSSG